MIELKRDLRRRRLLNLTPLIDIIFLLVVFFLLTSKFELSTGIVLSVHSGDAVKGQTEKQQTAGAESHIYLLDDYTIAYQNKHYTLQEYLSVLERDIVSKNSVTKNMHIFSSKAVSVQTVVTLMEELKARNIQHIQLMKMKS